jgi:hypothetical protein
VSGRRLNGRDTLPSQAGHLSHAELAVIATSLRELGNRLQGFQQRLAVLDAAVQASSGSTSRSTRASRSSTRPRSS